MRNARYISAALATLFGCCVASAQGVPELLRFSQYNYGFGTARSASMGGAFSSLGADMSSMTMNPAGLGMYRSSEVSVSPGLTLNSTSTNNRDTYGNFASSGDKTRFTVNNIGLAGVMEGNNDISFTLAVAYTKLADYNVNTNVLGKSSSSMVDKFASDMNSLGVAPPANNGAFDFYTDDMAYWGGMMAYNTYLLGYDGVAGEYYPDMLFTNEAKLSSRLRNYSTGSTGQFDVGLGVNIKNVLYVGLAIGTQETRYNTTSTYQEAPDAASALGLDNYTYTQKLEQRIDAWNFKFGVTAQPVAGLRLGAAIHTPSYITVEESYGENMDVYYNDFDPAHQWENVWTSDLGVYNLQTPTRFITGGSYTFPGVGIITVDYERVWYNKMKYYQSGWEFEDMNISDAVDYMFKPANNVRVGAEFIVTPNVFLRGGYAKYNTMYKEGYVRDQLGTDNSKEYGSTSNYSCGLGYRTKMWGVDFAYIRMVTKELPTRAFYVNDNYKSGLYDNTINRDNFTLTASVRF